MAPAFAQLLKVLRLPNSMTLSRCSGKRPIKVLKPSILPLWWTIGNPLYSRTNKPAA